MAFVSQYISHQPDKNGYIQYSKEENQVWTVLFTRQMALLPGRAYQPFIDGVKSLGLTEHAIPQLPEISQQLQSLTGWTVTPVAALISARDFFELLASRHFPAATFIRTEAELNYVKEPDIFHELFGHCPLLTDLIYANFMQAYAKKVLTFPERFWPLLQRLFWFTVEFGLINTPEGLRAYGGGILSSISETPYCIESDEPMRVLFEPVVAFRTPYRIDSLQPIYFVVNGFNTLYDFVTSDIESLMNRACELGEFPPFFPVDLNNPSIHILAC